MNEELGKGMDWDEQIDNDGVEFSVYPEGIYDYIVLNFERKQFKGSEKMSPCNQVVLNLMLRTNGERIGSIKTNLFLNTKVEAMLSAFFRSIGQKKHGEPLRMDWGKVSGSMGRCKVTIREWTKSDGQKTKQNEVKFLDSDARDHASDESCIPF